jgi:hypothetical protein
MTSLTINTNTVAEVAQYQESVPFPREAHKREIQERLVP